MNTRVFIVCSIVSGLVIFAGNTEAEVSKRDFEGFTVWIDCERNGAVLFEYTATGELGSEDRLRSFKIDEALPVECRQTSSGTYSGSSSFSSKYDRGHLVPPIHLDHSVKSIHDANIMSNILPQAANMNRGAWLKTEEIIECNRGTEDYGSLRVIGGVVWGFNPHDDKFLESHGIATPDYFWKVVISDKKQDAIAWIIPNIEQAKRKNLDRYLVSVAQIQKMMEKVDGGPEIGLPDGDLMGRVHETSWAIPEGCDFG